MLEIENFKEIDVDSYTQYIARSMPVKARYVSDGAVFYVFPEQCDEIIDKLNNKQYEYYELRYSDIFGINLNSFQIIGFEPTHLVCIGIGEASFQEKDENNTLDISVNKNVYSFPVKIPFTSLFKLRINCIL
ncbi:MAG TPA: hypothetical protein PK390_01705 [Fervidobacterium nodosum]|nr:hypothetical protein [Fervidobacterium nodosum]